MQSLIRAVNFSVPARSLDPWREVAQTRHIQHIYLQSFVEVVLALQLLNFHSISISSYFSN